MNCPGCGRLTTARELACPACDTLLHRDRLKELAALAAQGTPSEALTAWREAVGLLPPGSRQREQVAERIRTISLELDRSPRADPPPPPPADGKKRGPVAAVLSAVAAGAWKLKALIFLGLGKLKFLLIGLSKLPTLFSMLASIGVYTLLWGWPFAVGFVLSIYVHEIGHVVALRRFGIAATAPMFIPGFGAVVRMKQYPATSRENARVGIAGPVWGLGASAFGVALGVVFDWPLALAVGATSAMINLFNLLPIGSLDGGRAYSGLTRVQRYMVVAACVVGWLISHDPMTFLVGLVVLGRTFFQKRPEEAGDLVTTGWYAACVVLLSGLTTFAPGTP